MSYGSVAYQSYVRIRSESGDRSFPDWTELAHARRLAWEAAAQAVALAAFPSLSPDGDPDDGGCRSEIADQLHAAVS